MSGYLRKLDRQRRWAGGERWCILRLEVPRAFRKDLSEAASTTGQTLEKFALQLLTLGIQTVAEATKKLNEKENLVKVAPASILDKLNSEKEKRDAPSQ